MTTATVRFNWRKTGPNTGSTAELIATAVHVGDIWSSPNLSGSGAAQEGSVAYDVDFSEFSDPTSPAFPGFGSIVNAIEVGFRFEYSNYPIGGDAAIEVWDLRVDLPGGGVRYFTRGTHGTGPDVTHETWTRSGTRPGPEPTPAPYTELFLRFVIHPGGATQQFSVLEYAGRIRTLNTFDAGAYGFSELAFVVRETDAFDCFEDEALADSPELLWLFREGAGPQVADLSGNGHDGVMMQQFSSDDGVHPQFGTPDSGRASMLYGNTFTAFPGSSEDGAILLLVVGSEDETFSHPFSILDLDAPPGWTLVASASQDRGDFSGSATFNGYSLLVYMAIGGTVGPSTFQVLGDSSASHQVNWKLVKLSVQHGSTVFDVTTATDASLDAVLTPPTPSVPSPGGFFNVAVAVAYRGATQFLENGSPDWYGATLSSFGDSLYPSVGVWDLAGGPNVETVGIAIDVGAAPALMANIVFEYADPTLGITWADTNICDVDCADDNGALHFPGIGGAALRAPSNWFPFTASRTAWTLELLARVDDDSGSNQLGMHHPTVSLVDEIWTSSAFVFGGGLTDSGLANAERYVNYSPFRAACFQHVILVVDESRSSAADRVQMFVNGQLVPGISPSHFPDLATDDFDRTLVLQGYLSRVTAVAFYPSALPLRRIAAHVAHICEMCRRRGGFVLGASLFGA